MLYVNNAGVIRLTRGDTARLTVSVVNDINGQPYEIASTDILYLTVRKKVKDPNYCFQKKLIGSNLFHIEPEDTEELDFGNYVYDVQLTRENGDIYTVIEPTRFEVMTEVTY